MISGSPSLFTWSLSEPRPVGLTSFLRQRADALWFYGSSKAALRDVLPALAAPGETILVPSYLPDAVVEPVEELGLETRYYAIEPDLSPDLADLERRLDDRTAAVVSVNYFGFPQPGLEATLDLAEEYDCYHVDDNAHGALSVDDGTLLGTRGHVGVASLWKLLPIPNGAVLYVSDEAVRRRFTPSPLATPRAGFDTEDYRFVMKSLAVDVLSTHTAVKQSIGALVSRRGGGVADPRTRYEASKEPLSKLSERILEDADPAVIRSARRENYRAWRRALRDRSDVDLLFPDLADGICPQVCPVRATRPARFRRELERCDVGGVHTWPRLAPAVLTDSTYETARTLSESVLTLPVHQHIDAAQIDAVGRCLR
ncbi:DegT/DnrJ/EryC1/StrS family aminotransferase [Natronobiforma cellulositropha]|uniref:DegT/DnrJ/EryC1/StrS family aminotransferase n=1 Tax=Natronobiforma cellulositropha TaxID=1679076 RepID=UPI0021D5EB11|nr:DegT/DnrJ/EryC1/StrS family aminotransferase [Natronobiforma cellulositropha]